MKRLLLVLAVSVLLLTACQTQPESIVAFPTPDYAYSNDEYEPESPTPLEENIRHDSPTREDYIEMLNALQHAFATGEFEAFIAAYPGWDEEGREMPGPAVNEWPALLEGVTAAMTFDEEDVVIDSGVNAWTAGRLTVQLYVSGGNRHLPDGEQVLRLDLIRNRDSNTPSIYGMMLITDRCTRAMRGGVPLFEHQILGVAELLTASGMPLYRTMIFLDAFEGGGPFDWGLFTYDEVVAGANKYLGFEDFSPADSYLWTSENEHMGALREPVWTFQGEGVYYEVGTMIGYFLMPPRSVFILDAPSHGDLTARVFIYADYFLFVVDRAYDFNFLILHDEDGTPYAKLLSEQEVNLD